MKKLILFLFLTTVVIQAQERNFEKIKAHKTAYITQEIDLSPAQAEKFWPVYNQHEKEVMALRKAEREEREGKKEDQIDGLSDSQANEMLANYTRIKSQMTAKQENLIKSLKGIITPQQTLKLLKAEDNFKRRLLRRFGERKERKERKEGKERKEHKEKKMPKEPKPY